MVHRHEGGLMLGAEVNAGVVAGRAVLVCCARVGTGRRERIRHAAEIHWPHCAASYRSSQQVDRIPGRGTAPKLNVLAIRAPVNGDTWTRRIRHRDPGILLPATPRDVVLRDDLGDRQEHPRNEASMTAQRH